MKSDKIQTTRLYELDLLKALAIVSMILCHCVIRLGQHWPGFEQDLRYLIGMSSSGNTWPWPTPSCSPWASRSTTQRRTAPADCFAGASGSTCSASSSTSSGTGSTRWPTGVFGPLFLTKNGWYYAASLPEAAGLLPIDLTLLGAFHLLLKRVDVSRLSVFITMSRNVNQIYCIHWCILGFVDSIFCYLLGVVFPWPFIYMFGVALVVLSAWLAKRWADRRRAAMTEQKTEGEK